MSAHWTDAETSYVMMLHHHGLSIMKLKIFHDALFPERTAGSIQQHIDVAPYYEDEEEKKGPMPIYSYKVAYRLRPADYVELDSIPEVARFTGTSPASVTEGLDTGRMVNGFIVSRMSAPRVAKGYMATFSSGKVRQFKSKQCLCRSLGIKRGEFNRLLLSGEPTEDGITIDEII